MNKIYERLIYIAPVLLVILYAFYQHTVGDSWDFIVYVLNAKFYFDESIYFEILRPPLASLIIAFFGGFFSWKVAEYLFLALIPILFGVSVYFLATALKFNKIKFYLLSFTPFLVLRGSFEGTELLTLTLLNFFIYFILKDDIKSGILLALGFLARYNFLVFLPLIFFQKSFKKIIYSLLASLILVMPWLLYNFLNHGNFFFSIADQYANNLLFRKYILDVGLQFSLTDFFVVLGIYLPLLVYGVFVRIKKWNKIDTIFVYIFILTSLQYINIPLTNARYLFLITLPAMYFTYQAIDSIKNKNRKKVLFITILLINIIMFISLLFSSYSYFDSAQDFRNISENIENKECATLSNIWVHLLYYGVNTGPAPHRDNIKHFLDEGYNIFLLRNIGDPDYVSDSEFMNSLPLISQEENFYFIKNDVCLKHSPYTSYMHGIKQDIFTRFGYEININPCFVLANNISILERTCNLVNGNGFTLDENRVLP